MADKTPEEKSEFLFNLRREDAQRVHDAESEFHRQTNQAAIDTGSLVNRTLVLINGGAAVAMLTFVGGMVAQGRLDESDLHGLARTLMWFAWGVALAAASIGAAYSANYSTASMSSSRKRLWDHPYIGEPACKWVALRTIFLIVAVLAGTGSLASFIAGMYKVEFAVKELKLVTPKSPNGDVAR